MNTNKLKTFAKNARLILLKGVRQRLSYWGFDENGNVVEEVTPIEGGYMFRGEAYNDPTVYKKWTNLKSAIKRHTFEDIVEEAAYTWFNRLIAIKILEKNGYVDPVYEYVSDELQDPVILHKARKGDTVELRDDERKLLSQYIVDSKDEEAFGLLIMAYCRNQKLLNRIFGRIDDYTELLLPNNLLSGGGIVEHINSTEAITDDDYKQVELIGWLYQFYISDRKDEVFAGFKKKKKARPEDIPAATQIFTPKWIVKYMVENTVGRIWLDLHPDSTIRDEMKYLVEPADKENYKPEPIIKDVTELTLMDPASGSGHILVEGFDLLMKMYLEEGYTTKNAVERILKNNLYGLEIDDRAAQLANFAVLMKAASYDTDILRCDLGSNVFIFPEAVTFTKGEINLFLGSDTRQYSDELESALSEINIGKNVGSALVLKLSPNLIKIINRQYNNYKDSIDELDFGEQSVFYKFKPYIEIILTLVSRYQAVVTNPPYMGNRNMNDSLKGYTSKQYPDSKYDLLSIFIEVVNNLNKRKGRSSVITLHSWMFTSSYERLRKKLIENNEIESLIHVGRGLFGSDSGTVVFAVKKDLFKGGKRLYRKLFMKEVNVDSIDIKKQRFLNPNFGRYEFDQTNYLKLPGYNIAYWLGDRMLSMFELVKAGELVEVKQGLATTNNNRFLRYWYEVSIYNIGFSLDRKVAIESKYKWFPYNKGGDFRKWYGNQEYIIDWSNDGAEIKSQVKEKYPYLKGNTSFVLKENNPYFKESVSWTDLTWSLSARYYPKGFLFDVSGHSTFYFNNREMYGMLSYLNTKFTNLIVNVVNSTYHFQIGDFKKIPYPKAFIDQYDEGTVLECIRISKTDWNSQETSWGFSNNELIRHTIDYKVQNAFRCYCKYWENQFIELHQNEEELNRNFIDIYRLDEELNPDVLLTDITILKNELDFKKLEKERNNLANFREKGFEKFIKKDVVIQQLLSYAIGCIMGRYRLDKPGLNIAHQNPMEEVLKAYNIKSPLHDGKKDIKYEIDENGIIPMMGSESNFSDDVVVRIKRFIEIVWGDETLTENINFTQQCLDKDLEAYLVNDFWNYHCRMYKKRPIYWLFSAPKGAFKVLVYMHRMNKFTVQKIRNNYLLKHLTYLRGEIAKLEENESNLSKTETKRLDQLRSDEIECREYDKLVKDYADKQIEFDLDDGVSVNYKKFEGIVAPIK
jgi:hypothetical protein